MPATAKRLNLQPLLRQLDRAARLALVLLDRVEDAHGDDRPELVDAAARIARAIEDATESGEELLVAWPA